MYCNQDKREVYILEKKVTYEEKQYFNNYLNELKSQNSNVQMREKLNELISDNERLYFRCDNDKDIELYKSNDQINIASERLKLNKNFDSIEEATDFLEGYEIEEYSNDNGFTGILTIPEEKYKKLAERFSEDWVIDDGLSFGETVDDITETYNEEKALYPEREFRIIKAISKCDEQGIPLFDYDYTRLDTNIKVNKIGFNKQNEINVDNENFCQSKYCYKGTEVLVNKFNITNQEVLDTVEANITNHNLMKLQVKPIVGNFDLKHLEKIHEAIFKDIYPFAGKLRDENIYKGNSAFASAQYVKPCADDLFKKLKKEKYLKGQPLDKFCERAADYMSEINMLHPFREGNGRTQREFIRSLASKNGYNLDWSKASKEEMIKASISAATDTRELANLINGAIENKEPLKEIMKAFVIEYDYER